MNIVTIIMLLGGALIALLFTIVAIQLFKRLFGDTSWMHDKPLYDDHSDDDSGYPKDDR